MRYAEFILLMALMMSTVAMSTDGVLPALPMIGEDLGVADENRRQLVVGALFLGLAAAQTVFGPLSDAWGRKPIIYFGFALFIVGCAVAVLATTFESMLLGRFIQGVGVAAPRVVAVAVVRDRFEGRQMAKTTSLIMTIFILVPVFAPTIGQAVLKVTDYWQGIFGFFALMAVVTSVWSRARLPETLPPDRRMPLSFRRVGAAFREVLTHRTTMGYLLAASCLFSAMLGYVTSAQQILQELYGLGDLFPVAFGALAGSIGLASFANSRLVVRFGMRRLARIALLVFIGMMSVFLAASLASAGMPPLWLLFVVLVPAFFCLGMLFGNLNAMAMQPMGHIAGSAAAVIGTATTGLSATFGSLIGQSYNGTVLPLAISFFVAPVLALAFTVWAER